MTVPARRSLCAFVLLALGLAVSPVPSHAESLSPESVQGAETITTQKAKELFDAGVLFVDSRSKAAFDAGRIPGAENIPLSKTPTDADYEAMKVSLTKVAPMDKPVVMYCQGPTCHLSGFMATKAVAWGYKTVYYYREGFPAWKAAGYAVE